MMQYHDEIAFYLPKGQEEFVKVLLTEAIETINNTLKLNVPLGISVDFGENYAKIH